jgi:hypothetical protein
LQFLSNSGGFLVISNRFLAARVYAASMSTTDRPIVVLTPRELGARWKLSPDRIAALIRSGQLRAFNTAPGRGRRWRIPLEAVLDFEEKRQCPAATPPRRRRRHADDDVIEFFPKPR